MSSAFERWVDVAARFHVGERVDASLAARHAFNELKRDLTFEWLLRYLEDVLDAPCGRGGGILGDGGAPARYLHPSSVFCLLSLTDPEELPVRISRTVALLEECAEGREICLDHVGLVVLGWIASRCGSLGEFLFVCAKPVESLLLGTVRRRKRGLVAARHRCHAAAHAAPMLAPLRAWVLEQLGAQINANVQGTLVDCAHLDHQGATQLSVSRSVFLIPHTASSDDVLLANPFASRGGGASAGPQPAMAASSSSPPSTLADGALPLTGPFGLHNQLHLRVSPRWVLDCDPQRPQRHAAAEGPCLLEELVGRVRCKERWYSVYDDDDGDDDDDADGSDAAAAARCQSEATGSRCDALLDELETASSSSSPVLPLVPSATGASPPQPPMPSPTAAAGGSSSPGTPQARARQRQKQQLLLLQRRAFVAASHQLLPPATAATAALEFLVDLLLRTPPPLGLRHLERAADSLLAALQQEEEKKGVCCKTPALPQNPFSWVRLLRTVAAVMDIDPSPTGTRGVVGNFAAVGCDQPPPCERFEQTFVPCSAIAYFDPEALVVQPAVLTPRPSSPPRPPTARALLPSSASAGAASAGSCSLVAAVGGVGHLPWHLSLGDGGALSPTNFVRSTAWATVTPPMMAGASGSEDLAIGAAALLPSAVGGACAAATTTTARHPPAAWPAAPSSTDDGTERKSDGFGYGSPLQCWPPLVTAVSRHVGSGGPTVVINAQDKAGGAATEGGGGYVPDLPRFAVPCGPVLVESAEASAEGSVCTRAGHGMPHSAASAVVEANNADETVEADGAAAAAVAGPSSKKYEVRTTTGDEPSTGSVGSGGGPSTSRKQSRELPIIADDDGDLPRRSRIGSRESERRSSRAPPEAVAAGGCTGGCCAAM